jgi:hypothetical protein
VLVVLVVGGWRGTLINLFMQDRRIANSKSTVFKKRETYVAMINRIRTCTRGWWDSINRTIELLKLLAMMGFDI